MCRSGLCPKCVKAPVYHQADVSTTTLYLHHCIYFCVPNLICQNKNKCYKVKDNNGTFSKKWYILTCMALVVIRFLMRINWITEFDAKKFFGATFLSYFLRMNGCQSYCRRSCFCDPLGLPNGCHGDQNQQNNNVGNLTHFSVLFLKVKSRGNRTNDDSLESHSPPAPLPSLS